jgi:hypothetical protein
MVFESFAVLPYIVASAAYFLLGTIWYMPLFGRAWSKEVGAGDGSQGGNMAGPMLGQVASSFLFALGIYMIIGIGKLSGLGGALLVGLSVGLLVGFWSTRASSSFRESPSSSSSTPATI